MTWTAPVTKNPDQVTTLHSIAEHTKMPLVHC
jgi:hypothetical protein